MKSVTTTSALTLLVATLSAAPALADGHAVFHPQTWADTQAITDNAYWVQNDDVSSYRTVVAPIRIDWKNQFSYLVSIEQNNPSQVTVCTLFAVQLTTGATFSSNKTSVGMGPQGLSIPPIANLSANVLYAYSLQCSIPKAVNGVPTKIFDTL